MFICRTDVLLQRNPAKRMPWSRAEVALLLDGVTKYGAGNWSIIHAKMRFVPQFACKSRFPALGTLTFINVQILVDAAPGGSEGTWCDVVTTQLTLAGQVAQSPAEPGRRAGCHVELHATWIVRPMQHNICHDVRCAARR